MKQLRSDIDISILPEAGQKELYVFYEALLVKYKIKKSYKNKFLNELLPKKLEKSKIV